MRPKALRLRRAIQRRRKAVASCDPRQRRPCAGIQTRALVWRLCGVRCARSWLNNSHFSRPQRSAPYEPRLGAVSAIGSLRPAAFSSNKPTFDGVCFSTARQGQLLARSCPDHRAQRRCSEADLTNGGQGGADLTGQAEWPFPRPFLLRVPTNCGRYPLRSTWFGSSRGAGPVVRTYRPLPLAHEDGLIRRRV